MVLVRFTPLQGQVRDWAVAAILALLLGAGGPACAAAFQPHEDIRQAAIDAAAKQLAPGRGRLKATAVVDERLRLTRCSVPLAAKLPYATGLRARTTAEVSCAGAQPWKLFVPVNLEVWQAVLVATGPLPRGHLLTAADVELAERTLGQQNRGYILDPERAVGFRLKRSLSTGDVVTPGVMVAPPLIEKGQRVTLQARSGALLVQMAGVALEPGLAGDIIRVENSESGRNVEGVVRSAKTVEVLLN